jgi:hypothetical protein
MFDFALTVITVQDLVVPDKVSGCWVIAERGG